MTMFSFRIEESEAADVERWAHRLSIDRSELLRQAVHQLLVTLQSEADAVTWEQTPPNEAEQSLARVADWGPADDWSDWADAAR